MGLKEVGRWRGREGLGERKSCGEGSAEQNLAAGKNRAAAAALAARMAGRDGRESPPVIFTSISLQQTFSPLPSTPRPSQGWPNRADSRSGGRGASRLLGSVNEFAVATLRLGTEAIGLGVAVTNCDCALTRTSQRPPVTAHIRPRPPVTSAFLLGQTPA